MKLRVKRVHSRIDASSAGKHGGRFQMRKSSRRGRIYLGDGAMESGFIVGRNSSAASDTSPEVTNWHQVQDQKYDYKIVRSFCRASLSRLPG